ncbi:MAG TPA: cyclic nucleotide-binding and patatin-like phospholipase domain-containing protein [Pirellulales bacterium]|nr:cyclic nucleotide-binding and patatin-like phospholipase domain-containing protein [Pirellulales bacterium]
MKVAAGQVAMKQGEAGRSMFLVLNGRVRVTLEGDRGPPRLLAYLGPGEHFGDMVLLGGGLRAATVTAVVDTELLELDQEQFNQLVLDVPAFSANLGRTLVQRLRQEMTRRRRRERPTVIGLVNTSARTQSLTGHLAAALLAKGESIEVLTDRADGDPPGSPGYLVERLPTGLPAHERARLVRERIHQVAQHHHRTLLDVTQAGSPVELAELLAPCEEVWWLCESRFVEGAADRLREVAAAAPDLAARTHWVWILRKDERFSPLLSELPIVPPDFKVTFDDDPQRTSRRQRHAIDRLVRHLRGTRLGLALGGGAARGLAHLGALKALDREGIHFDLVAGTSSGALMGMAYCGGWRPDVAIEELKRVLTPAKFFRALPGGVRWYLWSNFRRSAWETMLRPYLGKTCLEQLPIPLSVLAIDLIQGVEVVRDRGDAINALMETINLPYLSRPIMRDGMALVDGGVLNNLPGDILPERGADFVVGIDVVAKLPPGFGGPEGRKQPRILETLLRVTEVQAFGTAALRANSIDLLITPDTSAYEFADFSRAKELAELGEKAAIEVLPQLKQRLAELESEVTAASAMGRT